MNKDQIANLRKQYGIGSLSRENLLDDPIEQFKIWFDQAHSAAIKEPNAMILSTVNADGQPSARTVLLKGIDDKGFVFYTNYNSHKAKDIGTNPKVSLTFLWLDLERQIRIEGIAKRLDEESSTKYFQSRPKGSQLGAWASPQSEVLTTREELEERLEMLAKKYADVDVLPKPPHWGGFLVQPTLIEFWQGRASRLHDRFAYRKNENVWSLDRLAP